MRIQDALRIQGSKRARVRGFLLRCGDEPARLCTELLESMPPQCGGPSMIVEGADVASLPGTARGEDCVWTMDPVELEGVVEGWAERSEAQQPSHVGLRCAQPNLQFCPIKQKGQIQTGSDPTMRIINR